MSFRVVRQSKFRHVFGTTLKREDSYDGVRITRNAWDSPFCSVNSRFVAVALEAGGGGAFIVINLENKGRIPLDHPVVAGHTAAVLDVQFCPFNDYIIASASEDCTVKVWELPEGGLKETMTEPVVDLRGHQRRVGIVEWHPTAENMLFSAGFDYMIFGWNIATGKAVCEINVHTDTIYCMTFNWDGSQMATICKDKMLRVIDPRKGVVVQETEAHKGAKAARVAWCGNSNKIFTTGFSKMNERQYGIWDCNDLSKPLKMEMIDNASGVLFPTYDEDTKLMFVAGKGDGNIRYYEMDNEAPYCHYITEFKTSSPQRGVCFLPKRALNVADCEIARAYKLEPKGQIEVVSFTVPRKSTMFQEDLFPATKDMVATVSAEQWLAGQNVAPTTVSMNGEFKPSEKASISVNAEVKEAKAAVAAAKEEDKPPSGEKALLKAWSEQRKKIEDLERQLASANIKIRQLETSS